jgi:hypothetical protein
MDLWEGLIAVHEAGQMDAALVGSSLGAAARIRGEINERLKATSHRTMAGIHRTLLLCSRCLQ